MLCFYEIIKDKFLELCFYEMIKDKFLGKCSLMNCLGYDKFLFHELYINKIAFIFFFSFQSDKPVI